MKKISFYTFILSCLVLASCDQFGSIDRIEAENVLTDNSLFVDASSTEAVLNGTYKTWRSQGISEMRNCMFMMNGECDQSSFAEYSYKRNNVNPRSSYAEDYYSKLYLVVNQSCRLISGLQAANPKGLDEDRKKEILGEAYFNRAFANFSLLKSFGEFYDINSKYGIVLFDSPIEGNEAKCRSTVKETYALIASDLNNAIAMAPDYNGVSYRATKSAAMALKARMELYLKDYDSAIKTCDKIIGDGKNNGLVLEDEYADIFEKKFYSSEPIFTVYTEYPNEQMETLWGNPAVFYDWMAYTNTMLFEVADAIVGGLHDWEWDELYEWQWSPDRGFDKRFSWTFIEPEQGTGMSYMLGKYPFTDGVDDNTYFFIRLAEIYLIKAEAEARLEKFDDARRSLKPITDRASYADKYVESIPDSELLIKIFEHKYIELAAENFESWYDIVRYHVIDGEDFSRYNKDGYAIRLTHLNLPIPYQAIAGNNKLEQNPSYQYDIER